MKWNRIVAALGATTALVALGLSSCAPAPVQRPDPRYVESHSGGVLPRSATVKVVFAQDMGPREGAALSVSPLSLRPAAKGSARWIDARTLEFRPDRPLKPATVYRVSVDLGRGGAGQGPEGGKFQFEFAVLSRDFDVEAAGLVASASEIPDLMQLSGRLLTNDAEEGPAVEGLLAPRQEGRSLEVSWKHGADGKTHEFTVSGIRKLARPSRVELAWSGRSLGSASGGRREFAVPAKGSFEVLGFRASEGEESYAEIAFSEELEKGQDYRGLVQVVGLEDARFVADRNLLKAYSPSAKWPENPEIKVRPGLRSASGSVLAQYSSGTVAFNYELPELRFAGTGVILPTTQGVTIPVETKNLNGIIVEVFRIHEGSMTQFLQVNNLDQNKELYRVGKVVKRIEVPIAFDKADRNVWKRTGIDLSEIARNYPGGMFQVRLMFARRHVEYECRSDHPDFSAQTFPDPTVQDGPAKDQSYWDYAEDYYDGNSDNYWRNYQYRRDPCSPAFYRHYGDHDIVVTRNVLVSDIGVLAKSSVDGSLSLFTTDLRSAAPLPGVALELQDFQRQTIVRGTSDAQGMATLRPPVPASFVVASAKGQTSYLKLDEGLALSVSQFDVAGDKPREGLKGFIYGERGVWRPGDDIYLTFLLFDEERRLPDSYPVVLELQNPRGQLVLKKTFSNPTRGFYPMTISTQPEDPTGDWLATVRAGGASFTKTLKVESIMPNRLKASLSYGNAGYLDTEPAKFRLEGAWLHGAPAPGLKADVTATFSPAATSFAGFGDYVFEDPSKILVTERQVLWQGELDAESKASFTVALEPGENAPGKLRANLQSRIFEPSGVFSSESLSVDFSPYDSYVGLKTEKGDATRGMLLTDVDHPVQLALLDAEGKPLSGYVDVALYQVRWRWWWEKGAESLADFTSSESASRVSGDRVRVVGGRGTWNLRVNYPSWGRYFLVARSDSGHSAGKILYIDWPGWAGRASDENPGGAQMLTLSTPKPKYLVGDKVSVSFPSNERSRALVVVEAGGKAVLSRWLDCKAGSTSYDFLATPDMAPNVYVHVSLIQPHLQTANDLPIRLYGIQAVPVEDPATRLSPRIELPDNLAPASLVSFTVSEAAGRPMTYTVAVVDEGLLGLTRFSAANPWDSFYRREASLLRSWDLYQYVAGAWSGTLENLLAIGGGDDGFAGGNRKSNRFPPVVTYLGPFSLGAGETGYHSFRLPQYVGALRFMVVAASGLSKGETGPAAFGVVERSATVRSDLMVFGTLPRVLSPGERIDFPVTLYSYKEGGAQAKVRVEAKGPVSLAGPVEKTVSFSGVGDKTVTFSLQVGDAVGPAAFSLSASAGSATASQKIDIDVRGLAQPVYKVFAKQVPAGATFDQTLALPGLQGSNRLSVEVSKTPPLDLGRRLDWLIVYPHGCIEQTTSSVFPQLLLDKAVNLPPSRAAEIEGNVKAGIERLKSFQTPRGGFAYWPGESQPNEWGSSYAGHFLLLAKNRGYAVQHELLQGWLGYQRSMALNFGGSGSSGEGELLQAYRLYTMALAGSPDVGAMNRLREHPAMPLAAKWRLAAAYWLAGQRSQAADMARGLSLEVPAYRELDGTFGSGSRDEAMILEALNLIDPGSSRIEALVNRITTRLSSESSLSTQEIAYSLIALLPYAAQGAGSETPYFSYGYPELMRGGKLDRSLMQDSLPPPPGRSANLRFVNSSKTPLWFRVVARGTPAVESERSFEKGVTLDIGYRDTEGSWIRPEDVAEGSDFFAVVEIGNPTGSRLANLALTYKVPGAWEIANERLAAPSASLGTQTGKFGRNEADSEETSALPGAATTVDFDYLDIRDDRLLAYFGLGPKETKKFQVRLTRTYGGTFYLPSSSVEAMYDASIQAVQAGRWLGR